MIRWIAAGVLMLATLGSQAQPAAAPPKVFRYTFPVAETEEMALGCRDFHAWNDHEIVDGFAILTDESFIQEITATVAGVVIGERKTMQPFLPGGGDQRFRAAHSVPGKPGVAVEVDVISHGRKYDVSRRK